MQELDQRFEGFCQDVEAAGLKPVDAEALAVWDSAGVELKAFLVTLGPILQGASSSIQEKEGKSFASAVVMQRCHQFWLANGWNGKAGNGKGKLDAAQKGAGKKGKTKAYTVWPEGNAGQAPRWWDAALDTRLKDLFGEDSESFRWCAKTSKLVHEGMEFKGKKGPGKGMQPTGKMQPSLALPSGAGPYGASAGKGPCGDAAAGSAAQPAAWTPEEPTSWETAEAEGFERCWTQNRGYFWLQTGAV